MCGRVWWLRLGRVVSSNKTTSSAPAALRQTAGWHGILDGSTRSSSSRSILLLPAIADLSNGRRGASSIGSSGRTAPGGSSGVSKAQSLAERRAAISAGLAEMDGRLSARDGTPMASASGRTTKQSGNFIDRLILDVEAGSGGNGGISFVSKYRIPDGGHGGPGGDVIIRASEQSRSLAGIRVLQRAGRGSQGGPQKRIGAPGKPRIINVPLGTAVAARAVDAQESDEPEMYSWMLNPNRPVNGEAGSDSDSDCEGDSEDQGAEFEAVADLLHDGQELIVAQGGRGGTGNSAYGRQRTELRTGQAGQVLKVKLELKSLADVGLIGMPNAGKSTLLRALSAATPEVGAYPFTTLRPQLGTVPAGDGASTTVADIPGLIEGAHENRGLGHAFLRHVERTRVLVYVLDVSRTGASGGRDKHDLTPSAQLRLLMRELEQYDPVLLSKPSLVAANKMDALGGTAAIAEAVDGLGRETSWPVLAISGQESMGIRDFVSTIRTMCQLDAGSQERLG